uniref:Uncharacterized protein n=1 Tax=Candidatus Kentrum sp. TC TaxID=2126339 RepID=A0A450YY79_9GAMM|nr:MAG: hypothetical protein BECKTC1821D_GA0114238_10316 [Candidatus Kentron sp. TC]VFK60111.1 MAG: hypothetical protein BECKTC1821F_GA0114240_10417 [Candidatus Kentron sp. TC]
MSFRYPTRQRPEPNPIGDKIPALPAKTISNAWQPPTGSAVRKKRNLVLFLILIVSSKIFQASEGIGKSHFFDSVGKVKRGRTDFFTILLNTFTSRQQGESQRFPAPIKTFRHSARQCAHS